jgi:hypothetical protein
MIGRARHAVLATMLGAVALAATAGATQAQQPDPTREIDDPIPGQVRQGPVRLQLEVRASGAGLTAPLYGTYAPGADPAAPGATTTQPNILYVVDQDGPLWAVNTRTGAKRLFINTRTQRPLMPLGAFGPGTFDERGFLGVAFHPDYQVPGAPGFGKFYTYTSERPGTNADLRPQDHCRRSVAATSSATTRAASSTATARSSCSVRATTATPATAPRASSG